MFSSMSSSRAASVVGSDATLRATTGVQGAHSPLGLSTEDLSATQSMSPVFNSTLILDKNNHQNGDSGRH
jgi:hypothetical protein